MKQLLDALPDIPPGQTWLYSALPVNDLPGPDDRPTVAGALPMIILANMIDASEPRAEGLNIAYFVGPHAETDLLLLSRIMLGRHSSSVEDYRTNFGGSLKWLKTRLDQKQWVIQVCKDSLTPSTVRNDVVEIIHAFPKDTMRFVHLNDSNIAAQWMEGEGGATYGVNELIRESRGRDYALMVRIWDRVPDRLRWNRLIQQADFFTEHDVVVADLDDHYFAEFIEGQFVKIRDSKLSTDTRFRFPF